MRLILGDCLEVMKTLPDKSVDLIITSPGYGVGKKYGLSDDAPPKNYLNELLRISKVVCLFPGYVQMWTLPRPKITAIWLKKNAMTGGACFSRFAIWEPILFYGNWGSKRLFNNDVFEVPISNQSGVGNHPCPFPLKLIKQII